MAQYWTYGLNDQGEPQLLGPFEDEGEAQDVGAELNQVQVVYAPNRNAAITQLQRREQRGRRTRQPDDTEDTRDNQWTGAMDDIGSDYEELDKELENTI